MRDYKKYGKRVALFALVLVVVGATAYAYMARKNAATNPQAGSAQSNASGTPNEVPVGKYSALGRVVTLPTGKQEYRIMQSTDAKPPIVSAVINPVDVHVGDYQYLAITVQAEKPLKEAFAYVQTDKGTQTVELKEAKGAVNLSNLRLYIGSWTVRDTHDAKYITTFRVVDYQNNENKIDLAWTDACLIPITGAWSLSNNGASCTISSPDGVENGAATINSYTLTLNSTFAFNTGYSLSVTNGTLAVGTSGELKESYIWMYDSDSDGYPANTTQVISASSPGTGYRRRSVLTSISTTDCDDSNAGYNTSCSTGGYCGDGICNGDESFCGSCSSDCSPTCCSYSGTCDNSVQCSPGRYCTCTTTLYPDCSATCVC